MGIAATIDEFIDQLRAGRIMRRIGMAHELNRTDVVVEPDYNKAMEQIRGHLLDPWLRTPF